MHRPADLSNINFSFCYLSVSFDVLQPTQKYGLKFFAITKGYISCEFVNGHVVVLEPKSHSVVVLLTICPTSGHSTCPLLTVVKS